MSKKKKVLKGKRTEEKRGNGLDREKYTREILLNELRICEPNDFRNFLRTNGEYCSINSSIWLPLTEVTGYCAILPIHSTILFELSDYISNFFDFVQYIAHPFDINPINYTV